MRRPPPIGAFVRYPVTGGTILLAIGVTLARWGKVDVSPLLMDAHVRRGEFWRFVTSALPHGDVLHLLFDVYWVWVFGTLVEEMFGHARTFLLFALLAAGSMAAEYAVLDGGMGLSGVGYGLFGMLWVLSRSDQRFADAVDSNTVRLFVMWFFLCIVLTVAQVMPVANIAHGMGAVLGALIGRAVASPPRKRLALATVFVLLLAALLAGATVGRPWINLSSTGAQDEARMGYDALVAGRTEEGLWWYQQATRMRSAQPSYWFNLGLAYERLGKMHEAVGALERAHQMDPGDAKFKRAWEAATAATRPVAQRGVPPE